MKINIKIYFAILFVLIGLMSFIVPSTIEAQSNASSSASVSPTTPANEQAILNKIKKEVSQMNLVEKRGIMGTIVSIGSTSITINDLQNNTRFIDADEITKFYDLNGNTIGISDLPKGAVITALGLWNKDSEHLLARYINIYAMPTYLTGEIASIDRVNGTFMLAVSGNTQHKIDVEAFTKTYSSALGANFVRSGFSKLSEGDRVIIYGYPSKTDKTMTIANRILQFDGAPKDPAISLSVSPTAGPSATITSKPIK